MTDNDMRGLFHTHLNIIITVLLEYKPLGPQCRRILDVYHTFGPRYGANSG
ncbi:hypothetical protein BDK88_0796 [Natrinema hispanicum]|uniref:Uncharacterized protein n=1 Tax=Natrinema hispanicum TaxID=392421 RepID=A0A482YEA3_9EURY|nr:hypothetical protein BDK88_0796 [Natrinema hispanicum]